MNYDPNTDNKHKMMGQITKAPGSSCKMSKKFCMAANETRLLYFAYKHNFKYLSIHIEILFFNNEKRKKNF